jgi:hypothetical protein
MKCAACHKPSATASCSRCKLVFYCSKDCQKAQWRLHKVYCKEPVVHNNRYVQDIEELYLQEWSQEAPNRVVECHCELCARECSILPGAYCPHEILERIKSIGNTSLFDTMVQDFRVVENRCVFFLRPAQVHEQKGERAGFSQLGKCIHLDKNGCMLKRSDMPLGCRLSLPCKPLETKQNKANLHMSWLTRSATIVITLFEKHNKDHVRIGCDTTFQKELQIERMASSLVKKPLLHAQEAIELELQLIGEEHTQTLAKLIATLERMPSMSKV